MKKTLLNLTLLVYSIGTSLSQITWDASFGATTYRFSIPQEQFDKLPEWDVYSGEESPVSRMKALKIADDSMAKVKAPDGMKWQVSSITLHNAKQHFSMRGKWIWRVRYTVVPAGVAGGLLGHPPEYELAILMDETILHGEKIAVSK